MRLAGLLCVVALTLAACEADDPTVPAGGASQADHESVTFAGPGDDIEASLFGEGDVGVVLAHQNGLDQTSWYPFASKLAEDGYTALTFDFHDEDLDGEMGAALGFLRSQAIDSIFLVGASKGGTAALALAASDPDVAGIVTLSGVTSFADISLDESTVASIDAPKLFIVDPNDSASLDAEKFMSWASPPKELKSFPNSGHGTEMLQSDEESQIERAILEFIAAYSD
jgi:pimeloyl-ACP methyl ester carboxylesterase